MRDTTRHDHLCTAGVGGLVNSHTQPTELLPGDHASVTTSWDALTGGSGCFAQVPDPAIVTVAIAEEAFVDTFVGTAAPLFDMVVDPLPDVLVVGLAGELDLACADALAELVAVELAGLDRDVVFDLSRLDFIDLTGARLLGAAGRLVTRSGWRCAVASPSPLAARVLEWAGFADLLAGRCRREVVRGRASHRALQSSVYT